MTTPKPITVYAANCTGDVSNCLYPNEMQIIDQESAERAFQWDLVFAKYRGNYRSNDNFECSSTLPEDCDNDHSDNPEDWITPEDVNAAFPDVPHVFHFSRHNNKPKGDKGPRPRFHAIFLCACIDNAEAYAALKKRLQAFFPFFDTNALDAARFFYGTENPVVQYVPGSKTIDQFLDETEDTSAFEALGQAIPEGSRNSTMSRIGAHIIKRYGDTAEAKELFFQAAEQCEPPLDDAELEQIWRGKQQFYKKVKSQPGYIAPEQYNATGPVVWDTPIPFDEHELPEFPVDALPDVVRRQVLSVAQSTQTSPDMAAVESLGVIAMCAQGKYVIQGSSEWFEPLNLFTAVILPPAERKSSVLSMMIRPVEEYEQAENLKRNAEIVEGQMQLRRLEKEKKLLEDQAAKGKATDEAIKAKALEISQFKPVKPMRLFVDDVTSEKLVSVLADNKGTAAIVSAEGGIFDIIAGRYNKNVNLDVFLKGHSGDTIRVDRIGRASESIFFPALTMVLAVQPEVLNGLMGNSAFKGRGFTARFLYSMPKSSIGKRSFRTEPIPEKVKAGYAALVETILTEDAERVPLSLNEEAQEVLEALFNEIEHRLQGDLSEIPDWAGKFVGAVLRIAGVLHIMANPHHSMFTDVTGGTMENAVKIGRYFLDHAKAAYSLMGADAINKDAQYLLAAVVKEGLAEFSRRDAMRLCRRFKTASCLQPVLDRLCEYGYLAIKPVEFTPGTGRRPSDIYLTNPMLLKDSTSAAPLQKGAV